MTLGTTTEIDLLNAQIKRRVSNCIVSGLFRDHKCVLQLDPFELGRPLKNLGALSSIYQVLSHPHEDKQIEDIHDKFGDCGVQSRVPTGNLSISRKYLCESLI